MNEQAHVVVEIVRKTNVSYLDPEAGLNSSDIYYKFTPQFASGALFATSRLPGKYIVRCCCCYVCVAVVVSAHCRHLGPDVTGMFAYRNVQAFNNTIRLLLSADRYLLDACCAVV
jgi:hypothetical protein